MKKNNQHRTIYGEMVDPVSQECLEDLNVRIEDATFNRDCCPHGTASRSHYNGLLSLLRKQRKRLMKQLSFDSNLDEMEGYISKNTAKGNKQPGAMSRTSSGGLSKVVGTGASEQAFSQVMSEGALTIEFWKRVIKC